MYYDLGQKCVLKSIVVRRKPYFLWSLRSWGLVSSISRKWRRKQWVGSPLCSEQAALRSSSSSELEAGGMGDTNRPLARVGKRQLW